jgi:hypothetical protein
MGYKTHPASAETCFDRELFYEIGGEMPQKRQTAAGELFSALQ